MLLNFEQIKAITQGACYLDNAGGTVGFHRFNQEEEAMYALTKFQSRPLTPAGVQLRFRTDGDGLNIAFETAQACTRTYFTIDIFVNDKLCKRIQNFDEATIPEKYPGVPFPLGAFSDNADLGEGEKTVRIVLPWAVLLRLQTLEIKTPPM